MQTGEIISHLKNRDKKGLSHLYDQYAGPLLGVIAQVIPAKKVAEEVLKQTFLKIWNDIEAYDEEKVSMFTWMCQIARNTAFEIKCKIQYEQDCNNVLLNNNNQLPKKINFNATSIDVNALLKKLSSEHRLIIDYYYLRDFNEQQISNKLNIPLGMIKTRLKNAFLELQEILKKEYSPHKLFLLFICIILTSAL